jgi:hypothetical protein
MVPLNPVALTFILPEPAAPLPPKPGPAEPISLADDLLAMWGVAYTATEQGLSTLSGSQSYVRCSWLLLCRADGIG